MKILTAILLSVAISTIALSQEGKFMLTPTGLKNASDTTKDFLVIEFPNKSKEELFKQTELYVNKKYVSPKDVISKVGSESITINGYASKSVRRNSMHVFDMNYTVNIEFKDNKIKIASPSFTMTTYTTKSQKLWLVYNNDFNGAELGIWNRSLKLKSKMAKEDLEAFFNKYTVDLIAGIQNKSDW